MPNHDSPIHCWYSLVTSKPTFCGNICWVMYVCVCMYIVEKCPSCHGVPHSIGCLTNFSEPCPQKAIRALLMTSQRCSPADERGGPAVSSQGCTGCWMRLFILVSGQRECPDERLSSHLISTADMPFQELQIECLNPAQPRFCLLWPAGAGLAINVYAGLQVFESAGVKIGNCTTANREKQGFILLLSSRWHPPEDNI